VDADKANQLESQACLKHLFFSGRLPEPDREIGDIILPQ